MPNAGRLLQAAKQANVLYRWHFQAGEGQQFAHKMPAIPHGEAALVACELLPQAKSMQDRVKKICLGWCLKVMPRG